MCINDTLIEGSLDGQNMKIKLTFQSLMMLYVPSITHNAHASLNDKKSRSCEKGISRNYIRSKTKRHQAFFLDMSNNENFSSFLVLAD